MASSAGSVLRAARGRRLRRARGSGVKGFRCRCSQRVQRARGQGRGRPVAPESAAMSFGGRRRKRRWWRRCSASGTSWLGGGEEGVEAEPLGCSRERGRDHGRGGSRRRRRACSVRGTEEGESVRGREREQRGRKRSEGTRGVVVASLGRPGEAGGGRAGWRWRARRRRGVRPPGREEDDRGGGGRRWAGPLGELGQVSGAR